MHLDFSINAGGRGDTVNKSSIDIVDEISRIHLTSFVSICILYLKQYILFYLDL